MTVTRICPKCGIPSFKVSCDVINHFSKIKSKEKTWNACINPECKVAYFSVVTILLTKDLNLKLWYKTNSKESYICYCSKISREDIIYAVKKGAVTFKDVQSITGKNRTGFCKNENPLGQCCKEVFMYEIDKSKQIL